MNSVEIFFSEYFSFCLLRISEMPFFFIDDILHEGFFTKPIKYLVNLCRYEYKNCFKKSIYVWVNCGDIGKNFYLIFVYDFSYLFKVISGNR